MIIKYFELTNSTYSVYLSALFHHFFLVSRAGETIDRQELLTLGQHIQDWQALGKINPAIQHRLIEPVDFSIKATKDYTNYFDGQPAQPVHIAAGLPAPRPKLEKQILEHLDKFDAAVIKASSGQGKSTLAWRVGQYLYQQGRKVYQIHSCQTAESAGGLVEFLETRVRIGEAPIIIIDGLSAKHTEWAEFASRLIDLPVQFIVTTREEDWVRFGKEALRVRTGEPIKLDFNQTEAKQIYEELKRHKRIYPTFGHWQAAWERVYQRGLLMEYVYLLTRGEMLQQRLEAQLALLNDERDGGVKLAILRIIATAHDIGILLQTLRLRQYIKSQFTLQGDLGELLHQLEAEYYVRFDRHYIEGLHPVRSNHLVSLLHRYEPVSETLLILAALIEPTYLLTFGRAIPQRVDKEEQDFFYKNLVDSLNTIDPSDLSTLLLGIYQGEVEIHHQQHRIICDSVFKNGGYELFAMFTIPYPHEDNDPVDLFLQLTNDPNNHMQKAIRELPPLPIQQTSLRLIIPVIHRRALHQQIPLGQMGHLLNWFALFDLRVPLPGDEEIFSWLTTYESKAAYQAALGLGAAHPNSFNEFAIRHLDEIIHWLKRITGALSIEPNGDCIQIEYVLTDDKTGRATAESVERIDMVHAWLPMFQTYETNALIFPYPNEEIIDVVRQDAHKTLSPKVIPSPITVSLNRSWSDSLLEPYKADSIYSWQLTTITLREQALKCAQVSYRILELMLQRKSAGKPFKEATHDWKQHQEAFLITDNTMPIFPLREKISADNEELLKPLRKLVREWTSCLRNFYQQFTGLIAVDNSDTRRLSLFNLRRANVYLPEMQQAFAAISEQTIAYFDTTELIKQEKYWYGRLHRASVFYGEYVFNWSYTPVRDVAVTIAEYWKKLQASRYKNLLACLDSFAELTSYVIYKPDKLVDEEWTTHTVMGVEGLNAKEITENFEWFSKSLASVSLTNVDFLTVVACKEKKAVGGFRFRRDFFVKVAKLINGEEDELSLSDAPIPIILNADIIKTLPDVTWSEPSPNPIGKAITDLYQTLWQFVETTERYKVKTESDKTWKEQLINVLKQQSVDHLHQITQSPYTAIAERLKTWYQEVIICPTDWSGKLLAEHLIGTLNILVEE